MAEITNPSFQEALGLTMLVASSGYYLMVIDEKTTLSHSLARTEDGHLYRVSGLDSYPPGLQMTTWNNSAWWLDSDQLSSIWSQLSDMTAGFGHDRRLTAGAVALYLDGVTNTTEPPASHEPYTFEDCLRLVRKFYPRFSLDEMVKLLRRYIPASALLDVPDTFPFMYVDALYPDYPRPTKKELL